MYRIQRPCTVGVTVGFDVSKVTRYCKKRDVGDLTEAWVELVSSADHSLQVSSGSETFPVRVDNLTVVPSGASAFQPRAPHLLMILASSTSEMTVPLATKCSLSK